SASPVIRFPYVLPEGQEFSGNSLAIMALSRDGRTLAYVANRQLYLRSMDSLESHPIPGIDETPVSPFFSPDGQQIGYWSSISGELKRIAIGGGVPMAIAVASFPFDTPIWGEDDNIVWGALAGIMRVSAKGGSPEKLIDTRDNPVRPRILT